MAEQEQQRQRQTPPPIPPTGVEVTASHGNGWSLRPQLARVTVAVDGVPVAGGWGRHFIPLAPGRHHVRVWFRDMWVSVCQPREILVDVEPGRVARVAYHTPFGFSPSATIQQF